MLVVQILGGIGNQLFQYNIAKLLQKEGFDVCLDIGAFAKYRLHDGYLLDQLFDDQLTARKNTLNIPKILYTILKKLNLRHFDDKNLRLNSLPRNALLSGYWQSNDIFNQFKQIDLFPIKQNLSKKFIISESDIKSNVGLHVRRGDYLNSINSLIYLKIGIEYIKESLKLITSKQGCVTDNISVYSDEPKIIDNELYQIEGWHFQNNSKSTLEDFRNLCSHNIIIMSNSTFSYWAAILGYDNKTVICPKKWFHDSKEIFKPKEWIQL